MELVFSYPGFLSFLLLVPFFVLVYFFSIVYNKKQAVMFSNFEAMERFYDIEFFSKNFIALYLNILILVIMVFALAGASVLFDADSSEFSYVIVVDTSSSMAATDLLPSRLEAAKQEAKNYIELLPVGVEIGVIGFSGDATVYQNLDSSKLKSEMAVDNIDFGEIQGTNIYNALIAAEDVFGTEQKKIIVLISDGNLNVGDAPQLISYVNRNNIIVNTIAVGTEEGGVTEYDTISTVDLDFLQSIAYNSDGEFFQVGDIEELGESLSSLTEKTEIEIEIDLTVYLLIAAVLLFSIMWVLYNLRLKTVP